MLYGTAASLMFCAAQVLDITAQPQQNVCLSLKTMSSTSLHALTPSYPLLSSAVFRLPWPPELHAKVCLPVIRHTRCRMGVYFIHMRMHVDASLPPKHTHPWSIVDCCRLLAPPRGCLLCSRQAELEPTLYFVACACTNCPVSTCNACPPFASGR